MDLLSTFTTHDLGHGLHFLEGHVPNELRWNADGFQAAWDLHPAIRPSILIHGRRVQVPRWQQAYGEDYRFSGLTSPAEPVSPLIAPLLAWARQEVHPELNAILVNWYVGAEHYIGPHHDTTRRMLPGAPIVTVSFGEERVFRLSRGTGQGRVTRDFRTRDGTVFVIPRDTNDVWKHSVPKSARYTGRRISVTIRGFRTGVSLG
jgi:alkylated DNA repair dioxygenase AlkB